MKHLTFLAIAILWVTPALAQLAETEPGRRHDGTRPSGREGRGRPEAILDFRDGRHAGEERPAGTHPVPGVFIMLRKAEPSAPPAGSIVNHFGFVVKDMPAALARWKAANIKIEPTENPNEVYVLAPDGIRLEVYGEPALPTPVSMNHIHFYPVDIPGIKAWYVKAFGANPGRRPCVGCISKPAHDRGGRSSRREPVVFAGHQAAASHQGTLARSHRLRGENLEAFVSSLEAKGINIEAPIRQIPNTKVKIAFLTDPWGTYIELTEGLAPVIDIRL